MHQDHTHLSNRRRSRRGLSTIVAGAALVGLLAGCASAPDSNEESAEAATELSGQVVWADYGGPTNESRQLAYFDAFGEDTGVEVVSTVISDTIMLDMLNGEPGDYDVVQATIPDIINNAENLVELPEDLQSDLLPEAIRPYGVGGFYLAFAQGWLTDTFPEGGPQDWGDFFDVEQFPGMRAWPGSPGAFDVSLEIALLADGVAPEDLYPLDFDRAYAKMDELRPHMVFYSSYPEVQQLLVTGSASMAVTVSGQYTALSNAGEDVTIQWNQAFVAPNAFVIPKTAPNLDNALALAESITIGEREAVFSERTLYGPVNSGTFDHISEEVLVRLANAPENADKVIVRGDEARAAVFDELLATYTEWLAG